MVPTRSFLRLLLLLVTPSLTLADLQFTSPTSSSSFQGGSSLTVAWRDNPSSIPPLSQYTHYTLDLCTGPNNKITLLYTLLSNARLGGSDSGSVQVVIPANVCGSAGGQKVYFLRMTLTLSSSNSPTFHGSIIHFTPRFSLTSMTGTFPPSLPSFLLTSSAGSPPPDTVKNLIDITLPQDSKAPDIPYPAQVGPIRYAPMQRQPGRSITAIPTPAGKGGRDGWGFSKSKVEVYYTRGEAPSPNVSLTVTKEWDYVVTSLENMASPAPMPQDSFERPEERHRVEEDI